MSVDWLVLPVEPNNPDFVGWLQVAGLTAPETPGRHPTVVELADVLASFGDIPFHQYPSGDDSLSVDFGDQQSDTYAHMSGTVHVGGVYHFSFRGPWSKETTMLEILHRLSATCGPLVLVCANAPVPALITPFSDLATVLTDWQLRQRGRSSGTLP